MHMRLDYRAVVRILLIILKRNEIIKQDLQNNVVRTLRMENVHTDFDTLQLRDVAVHRKQYVFCFDTVLIAVVLQFETYYVLDHI